MKTLPLQETPTHYLIQIDRAALEQGPTLLAQEGQPMAVLLPLEDYDTFRAWQAAQRHLPTVPSDFEAEVAAFEQLKPTLLEDYQGQAVAIYQGEVVEVGDDKMEVLGRVIDKLGRVPCYIEWVEPDTPRRVLVPSVRVASQ